MPTLETSPPQPIAKLASFALVFLIFSLAGSDASAHSGEGFRGYFLRFYGQDFYDGQRTGPFAHRGHHRQYRGAYYGPAMIYGRQYGEENGYRTDPPFAPLPPYGGPGHGGNNIPR